MIPLVINNRNITFIGCATARTSKFFCWFEVVALDTNGFSECDASVNQNPFLLSFVTYLVIPIERILWEFLGTLSLNHIANIIRCIGLKPTSRVWVLRLPIQPSLLRRCQLWNWIHPLFLQELPYNLIIFLTIEFLKRIRHRQHHRLRTLLRRVTHVSPFSLRPNVRSISLLNPNQQQVHKRQWMPHVTFHGFPKPHQFCQSRHRLLASDSKSQLFLQILSLWYYLRALSLHYRFVLCIQYKTLYVLQCWKNLFRSSFVTILHRSFLCSNLTCELLDDWEHLAFLAVPYNPSPCVRDTLYVLDISVVRQVFHSIFLHQLLVLKGAVGGSLGVNIDNPKTLALLGLQCNRLLYVVIFLYKLLCHKSDFLCKS